MDGITNSTDMNLSKLQETVKARKVWRAAVHTNTTEFRTNNNRIDCPEANQILGAPGWLEVGICSSQKSRTCREQPSTENHPFQTNS